MQISVELQNNGNGQNANGQRNAGLNICVQSQDDGSGQIAH